ncbi:HK97-gp10 family putative phage morphogenesis protein [Lactobacillus amylolyticus]|uniref:HK97-gp10 family putative phage morphogenesis protein n=1 Tax=Lactobacillus amylolyticus TaxID=83683 RepID=UPI002492E43A|nr:HK97-gp10 family putative phage morphogenesis protein [Lactobacillus amylolyticus]
MADLGEQMSDWLEQIKEVIPNAEQSAEITEAGAKVLAERLKEIAPVSKEKEEKYGHLKDNITYIPTDIDGEKNGSSTVGFQKKAYIARFLNDGTIKMPATHWVDNARNETSSDVFAAQRKKYDELIGGGSK